MGSLVEIQTELDIAMMRVTHAAFIAGAKWAIDKYATPHPFNYTVGDLHFIEQAATHYVSEKTS